MDLPTLIASGYFGNDWKAVETPELQVMCGLSPKQIAAYCSRTELEGGLPRILIGGVTRYFLPHVRAWMATHLGAGQMPAYGTHTPPPAA